MENKEPNIQILSQTNRKFYSKKKKGFQLQFNTTAKV